MKHALVGLAMVAATGCLTGSAAIAASASRTAAAAHTQHPQITDISAAHRYYHRRAYGRRGPNYNYGWRAGDPTAGPNSLYNYYRRNNVCAIDEGYGRATRCD